MHTAAEVLSLALQLPESERAAVAQQLLLSLEPEPFDDDAGAAWQEEIEQRLRDFDGGSVAALDWRQAIAEARQSLRKKDPS
jgi:putative addiction module component (TIGR02574 family)